MSAFRARGQTLIEYLVVCMALAMALFLPYVQGESVTVLLARTLFENFRGTSFVMSII
jgi:hypothetical protein